MIDSINLLIKESDFDYPISFRDVVVPNIDVDYNKCSNNKIVGLIENIRICIQGGTLYIAGSLSKWYFGSNVKALQHKEIKKALNNLGEAIGISLDKAKIVRIDLAQTFKMKSLPELYFPELYFLKDFYRSFSDNSTLYFTKESKIKNGETLQLCFYDKNAELKKKNSYKEVQKDSNLFRYELRIKKPKRIFKREIHCFDLFSEEFYRKLIYLWYSKYNDIEKRIETSGDFFDYEFDWRDQGKLKNSCLQFCCLFFDMEKIADESYKKIKVKTSDANKCNVLKLLQKAKEELQKKYPLSNPVYELNEKVETEYHLRIKELGEGI